MFSPSFSVSSSPLPAFLAFFQPPLFFVSFIIFRQFYRGCSTPVIHLSLLFSSHFFLFSPLFSFSSFLFLSSLLFLFSLALSLQIFGVATTTMLHRFRRAWSRIGCLSHQQNWYSASLEAEFNLWSVVEQIVRIPFLMICHTLSAKKSEMPYLVS